MNTHTEKIQYRIEELLRFGVHNRMMEEWDYPLVRNQLLSLFGIKEAYSKELDEAKIFAALDGRNPLPILEDLLQYAVDLGMIEDNTTEKDLLDAKIMGYLMPRQSELKRIFEDLRAREGVEKATDFFYHLSIASNYIRMDRIEKNIYWEAETDFGNLEITINLSKPEKDPKEIAKAKLLPQSNYPKCLLCLENVGFEGNMNHPGRSNHRVLPVTLKEEQWFFQYSPYVYYNEHSIIFKGKHEPMKISRASFERLVDFVEQYPHYFIGSNADLPIVGGSILSHDHFQGGHHLFPMEVAKVLWTAKKADYPTCTVKGIKWPLSVLRISSKDKKELVDFADDILDQWRQYSDPDNMIYAYSQVGEEKVPHNTITPICRMNEAGEFEMDLVLRNNLQTEEHPDGLYHPHQHLHHIKKENIGLIEVMGLAVLPPRLATELEVIAGFLTGTNKEEQIKELNLEAHGQFILDLMKEYGTNCSESKAKDAVRLEVGKKFAKVLECAGVYKQDAVGAAAFERFLTEAGII